jgi:hypothetical protein
MAGFGGCGVGGWVAGVSLTLRKANNAKNRAANENSVKR